MTEVNAVNEEFKIEDENLEQATGGSKMKTIYFCEKCGREVTEDKVIGGTHYTCMGHVVIAGYSGHLGGDVHCVKGHL